MPLIHPTYGAAAALYMQSAALIRRPDDMLSSLLRQHILDYEPPCRFVILAFTMFDGSAVPYDHVLHYNQVMSLNLGNDWLLCKVFPPSLWGPALDWLHKIPHYSINLFNELWTTFISQYLCSVRQKRNISSL